MSRRSTPQTPGVTAKAQNEGADVDSGALKSGAPRRALPWIRAALLGVFVVTLLGEIGYGSFTPALLLPGALVGALAGVTARAVRQWRSWLGTGTVWVLVAVVWGALTWVMLRTAPRCPLEPEPVRCSPELAATWSVNMALAVAVLMLMLEPPRLLAKSARAVWRARRRDKTGKPAARKPAGSASAKRNAARSSSKTNRREPSRQRGARNAR